MRISALLILVLLGAVVFISLPSLSEGEEENDVCPGCNQFEKVGVVLDELTDTLNNLKDRVAALDGTASNNDKTSR